jgi:hypothetical protein
VLLLLLLLLLTQGNFIPAEADDETAKDAWLNSDEGKGAFGIQLCTRVESTLCTGYTFGQPLVN